MADRKEDTSDPGQMTAEQHVGNAAQMILQAIPFVGPVLDKAIFNTLNERRMNRVTHTLTEVIQRLRRVEGQIHVETEQFQALFESLVPVIARATNEDKRRCLRDLLIHAAVTPPDHPDWDEAELAARLVTEIDAPGLALLAAAGRLDDKEVTVWSVPRPAAYAGEHQFGTTGPGPELPRVNLDYSWVVLAEWSRRLGTSRGNGLFHSKWTSTHGGFAFSLSPLGRMLIRWALHAE